MGQIVSTFFSENLAVYPPLIEASRNTLKFLSTFKQTSATCLGLSQVKPPHSLCPGIAHLATFLKHSCFHILLLFSEGWVRVKAILLRRQEPISSIRNTKFYFSSDLFCIQSFVLRIKEHVRRGLVLQVLCRRLQDDLCATSLPACTFPGTGWGAHVGDLVKHPHVFAHHSQEGSL